MSSGAEKRGYLPSARRREELVAAGGEIVGRSGWAALTMKGLAGATGVSRQLVYVHFPDLTSLLVAVLQHLFQGSRQATEAILNRSDGEDRGAVARLAYQVYFDLGPAQRRALRSLVGSDPAAPALRNLRRFLRRELLDLWVPYARRQTGLDARRAKARVWMFLSAAWGLADLVEEGEITAAVAKEQLSAFAASEFAGERPRPSGKERKRA